MAYKPKKSNIINCSKIPFYHKNLNMLQKKNPKTSRLSRTCGQPGADARHQCPVVCTCGKPVVAMEQKTLQPPLENTECKFRRPPT